MTGSVSSSLRQGIWMISFMAGGRAGAGPRAPKVPSRSMSRLRQEGSALAVLGLILLGALALRLWNLDHGLPFAYNADEAEHFVPRALAIAGGGAWTPGTTRTRRRSRTCSRWSTGSAGRADAVLTARVVVALIGTLVVGLTFLAGRRAFDTRSGLVAAAVMAVAFLPVFYSKHALNDVVTLAPGRRRADRRAARLRARPLGRLRALRRRGRRGHGDEVHSGRDAAHARRRRAACACCATGRSCAACWRAARSRARRSSRCS